MKFSVFCFVFAFLFFGVNVFAVQNYSGHIGLDETQSVMFVVLCNIISLITGSVAQAISAIVIVIMGYSLFIGKVSVAMFFVTGAGIMLVFGAGQIVDMVTGGAMMASLNCTF